MSAGVTKVEFDLSDDLALALAQFCKRLTWRDMRSCAVDDDECREIRAAIEKLTNALAQAGWEPR